MYGSGIRHKFLTVFIIRARLAELQYGSLAFFVLEGRDGISSNVFCFINLSIDV
jgi:hypothetical protein